MKNWLFGLFVTLTLSSIVYFQYKIHRLYLMVNDANSQISELQKEPMTCTMTYPDGSTSTRNIRHDRECSNYEMRQYQKSCQPYPECQKWPEINDRDYPPEPKISGRQKFSDNYLSCSRHDKDCDLVEGKERKRLIGNNKVHVKSAVNMLKRSCLTLHKLNDNSMDCYWRSQ